MDDMRCLICGVKDEILGEIIKRSLLENNIQVHNCDKGFDNLLNAVSDDDAYTIVGLDNKQLPDEYDDIFNKNNGLIVVELLNDGKSLGLYINDINQAVLNKIININL